MLGLFLIVGFVMCALAAFGTTPMFLDVEAIMNDTNAPLDEPVMATPAPVPIEIDAVLVDVDIDWSNARLTDHRTTAEKEFADPGCLIRWDLNRNEVYLERGVTNDRPDYHRIV